VGQSLLSRQTTHSYALFEKSHFGLWDGQSPSDSQAVHLFKKKSQKGRSLVQFALLMQPTHSSSSDEQTGAVGESTHDESSVQGTQLKFASQTDNPGQSSFFKHSRQILFWSQNGFCTSQSFDVRHCITKCGSKFQNYEHLEWLPRATCRLIFNQTSCMIISCNVPVRKYLSLESKPEMKGRNSHLVASTAHNVLLTPSNALHHHSPCNLHLWRIEMYKFLSSCKPDLDQSIGYCQHIPRNSLSPSHKPVCWDSCNQSSLEKMCNTIAQSVSQSRIWFFFNHIIS